MFSVFAIKTSLKFSPQNPTRVYIFLRGEKFCRNLGKKSSHARQLSVNFSPRYSLAKPPTHREYRENAAVTRGTHTREFQATQRRPISRIFIFAHNGGAFFTAAATSYLP